MSGSNTKLNGKKGFSVLDFFMLGFGSMIGVGWTVSVGNWLQITGGPAGTILAFLIGTLAVIPIGLCYGELTAALPVAGGAMAFGYRAKGSRLSFMGGWLNSLAYIVLLPWEMIYITHILGLLFPVLAAGEPLYTILGHPVHLGSLIVGIVLTVIMVGANLKGAELSGKLQTGFTLAVFVAAAFIMVFSIIKADMNNLLPAYTQVPGQEHTNFLSGFIGMLVIVPFFMAGFDTIPQAVEDADEGLKFSTIAKVLVATIAAAGLFYIVIVFSASIAYPWRDLATLETPAVAFMFVELYGGTLGKVLYYIVLLGALGGLFSTFNGMFIAATRLLFSMGRAKLLPDAFGTQTEADTPHFSTLFCGVATIIGIIFGLGVIDPLTNTGSLAFVLCWGIACYSALVLRDTEPNLERTIQAGKGKGIIILANIIAVILAVLSVIPASPGFMSYPSLAIFIVWMILGGIFFYISRNRGEQITEEERHRRMFLEDEI